MDAPVAHAITISRRVRFSAARRLESAALDAEGNARLFGRDRRPHGHDFTLEVTLAGRVPAATGMVMDLKALSELLKSEVVARLDRTRLEESPLLGGLPATGENLAAAIWRAIEPRLPPRALVEVVLAEGRDKTVRYRGEEGAAGALRGG